MSATGLASRRGGIGLLGPGERRQQGRSGDGQQSDPSKKHHATPLLCMFHASTIWLSDRMSGKNEVRARHCGAERDLAAIDPDDGQAERLAADQIGELRLSGVQDLVLGTACMLEQVSRARNNLNRYWRLAWKDEAFPLDTQNEHKEILELCLAKNRPGLVDFIERHILTSERFVLNHLQQLKEDRITKVQQT